MGTFWAPEREGGGNPRLVSCPFGKHSVSALPLSSLHPSAFEPVCTCSCPVLLVWPLLAACLFENVFSPFDVPLPEVNPRPAASRAQSQDRYNTVRTRRSISRHSGPSSKVQVPSHTTSDSPTLVVPIPRLARNMASVFSCGVAWSGVCGST